MLKKNHQIFLASTFFITLLVVPTTLVFPMNRGENHKGRSNGERVIQTDFGLMIFLEGDFLENISAHQVNSPLNLELMGENNTLDIFFNISSNVNCQINISLEYHYDDSFGNRPARFYPESFAFAEILQELPYSMENCMVDINERSITLPFNVFDMNKNHTFTITGELDKKPPAPVENITIEPGDEGAVSINFDAVADALGYYIYRTEREYMDVGNLHPYLEDPIQHSYLPIQVNMDNEIGQGIYICIAPMDNAGNVNYNVEPQYYIVKEANQPPISNIDPLHGFYYTDEVIFFTCRGTRDPDPDDRLTYSWDFDGDQVEDSNYETPIYSYDTPGTYLITLTVTDLKFSTDEDTMEIIIHEKALPSESSKEGEKILLGLDLFGLGIGSVMVLVILVIILSFLIHRRERGEVVRQRRRVGGKKVKPRGERRYIHFVTRDSTDRSRGLEVVPEREFSLVKPTYKPDKEATVEMERKKEKGKDKNSFLVCGHCSELLQISFNQKGGEIDHKYPISCPVCKKTGVVSVAT